VESGRSAVSNGTIGGSRGEGPHGRALRTVPARLAYLFAGLALALPPTRPLHAQGFDLLLENSFDETPGGPRDANEAARFLTQATYGPTLAEIHRVRGMAYDAWLNEQFAATPTLHLPLLDARIAVEGAAFVYNPQRVEEWFRVAVTSNDELRQRVAFALSQIIVISDRNGMLAGIASSVSSYYDVLVRNSFGNYRTLLEETAKHPAMGFFLSSLKNRKSNQAGTIRPDENFAREVMQLFSIGLVMLNPDGTPVDADGNAANGVQVVPTYTQDTIRGFAKVYTGWNFSTCTPTLSTANIDTPGNIVEYERWYEWDFCPHDPDPLLDYRLGAAYRTPMQPWEIYHNKLETKQLLNYPGVSATTPNGVLAAGGTAQADLTAALDNIFRHPNVGPFVGRQLIQRLVTSNPSPAYVGRVAAAFNDNGSGVRGDLRATVRAILLDPEARNPTNQACLDASTGCPGKLREPLLRGTQKWRALDARPSDPRGIWRYGYDDRNTGQVVLNAYTVFNFYLPHYAAPGPDIAGRGLVSPEFQITVDSTLIGLANLLPNSLYFFWIGSPYIPTSWGYYPIAVSLDREMALAHQPAALLDRLNLLFMAGTMTPAVAQVIQNHLVSTHPFGPGVADADVRRARVQDAIYLIMLLPEHVVEK
jgi:uncharacterized protein (DUF1800 family)